ncbi:MAG: amidohydrolase, partial [Oscillochloris sp.]|nr:amidohydrolase [Oscillochloris sp.]
PAEEGLGGALSMIKDGILEGPTVDYALGLHVSSWHPVGTAAVVSGPTLAASDKLDIIVHGRGGHGAQPHQTIDAVLVASHIVVALQTVIARNIDPDEAGVVTIGAIHAGEAGNVIAETATMCGTIRCFSQEVRTKLHERIRAVAEGVASALGAYAEVRITIGVDPTISAPRPTEVVHHVAAEVLGEAQIITSFRTTSGEDFSAVLERVPGNFFMLGARNDERGLNFPHHNPHFDIDETCLPYGAAILSEAAMRCLCGEAD